VIRYAAPVFPNLTNLAVDDVDSEGWLTLIEHICRYGKNLKSLCLEACSEKDAFTSKKGLATVFPALKDLECVRFDSIPIGSSDFSWGGDLDLVVLTSTCLNLRAVTIDFCDVTLQSLFILWNNCLNLDFLGLAGVQAVAISENKLMKRPKLKTLRFVDCQIDDTLVILSN
jgi:hypothetical protein